MTESQIAERHFASWVKYYRAYARYRLITQGRRNWEMEVITLVGETGTGKSRFAFSNFPDAYYLPFPKQSGTYWDGYEGQSTVVIEEASGARFSYTQLLSLLDRYPMQVPIHGGSVQFVSRRILFTTNQHPAEWYDSIKYPYEGSPLERRLTTGQSRIVRVDMGGVLTLLEGAPLYLGWPHPGMEQPGDDENNNNNAE